jgi:S1-C subfamily serine protease
LGVQPGAFVFSLQGELVGMTLVNGDGASLLPARALVAHAERLQAEGSVRRGTLGISVQPLTTSLSAATSTAAGVVVAYVAPGGPAEGVLRIGDIIEAVNAVPITDIPSLAAQLGALPAGQQVTLGTIRQGTRMEVPLTAAGAAEPTLAGNTLGLTVRPVENVGTEVIVVIPGSAAAVAGLRPGDLITAVNGARPSRLTDISRAWSAPDGGAVLLGVQRAGRPLVMALQRP